MIDQIKNAAAAVRGFILWILTPLLLVAGLILYLFQKDKALQGKIDRMQKNTVLDKAITDAEKAQEVSNEASSDYRTVRDAYLKQHPDEGGDEV